MPTSLEFQSAASPQFIRDYWPQALLTASHAIDPNFTEIIMCGCGDSHHAAYSLSYALESWTGRRAHGLHAMEAARYAIPSMGREDLLVVGISASGETARTIEAIQLARESGAQTLAISADASSTLAAASDRAFILELPGHPLGPGLISYLGALLAGYAVGAQLATPELREQINYTLNMLPETLSEWLLNESHKGSEAAQLIDPLQPMLFLGSGPVRGTAMFSAAKVIEAAGQSAASQDLEEWAHLEYFNEPSQLPIWLLSCDGRNAVRETELIEAAARIGRHLILSQWTVGPDSIREELSPLALWAGPAEYANSMMNRIGENPFREFGGGRSQEEGGGASRIRSSEKIRSLKHLRKYSPPN